MHRSLAMQARTSRTKEGYSLIELIVVIAVMAILFAIGIPLFLKFNDDAIYQTAKVHFTNLRKSCIANPTSTPNVNWINGATITGGQTCSSSIKATMNEGKCCIKMHLANGGKNEGKGWSENIFGCNKSCDANEPYASMAHESSVTEKSLPSCTICKDREGKQVKVCAANLYLATDKCFDVGGAKKWWCNKSNNYTPGNHKASVYSTGSCSEQLAEVTCQNRLSGCKEDYKDPPKNEREYTVTPQ